MAPRAGHARIFFEILYVSLCEFFFAFGTFCLSLPVVCISVSMLDDTMLNQFICHSVLAIRSGLIMDWFLDLSVLLTVSVACVVCFFPLISDAWVILLLCI